MGNSSSSTIGISKKEMKSMKVDLMEADAPTHDASFKWLMGNTHCGILIDQDDNAEVIVPRTSSSTLTMVLNMAVITLVCFLLKDKVSEQESGTMLLGVAWIVGILLTYKTAGRCNFALLRPVVFMVITYFVGVYMVNNAE